MSGLALFEETFPPYHAFGSRTLSGGEQGTDVAVLQTVYDEMLKVMNPPQGPMGQPISITGVYDAATKQAVRNIQSYFGLSVDGIAGPDTYFLFGQGVGPNVTYGGPRYGSRTLSQGTTGGDVTVLQNRLNLFRYSVAIGAPADGVFGPKTATAVAQFQMDAGLNGDAGLPANGVVGSGTFDATWIYTYAGGRGIFTGRNGFDVVFLQVLLKQLGFYRGPIHGYYDTPTRLAVVAFQTSAGLSADGVVGQSTYYALGRRNPVGAPSPLPVPPIGPVIVPEEATCCFTLSPTTYTVAPAEGTIFVHNVQSESGTISAELVVSALLAPPSAYGAEFTHYGLVFNGGQVTPMTLCVSQPGGAGVWTFLFTTTSAMTPLSPVTVAISPLAEDETAGPVVAQGSGECPFPS